MRTSAASQILGLNQGSSRFFPDRARLNVLVAPPTKSPPRKCGENERRTPGATVVASRSQVGSSGDSIVTKLRDAFLVASSSLGSTLLLANAVQRWALSQRII